MKQKIKKKKDCMPDMQNRVTRANARTRKNTACKNTALIIVNAQNEYFDGALAIPGIETALAELERSLFLARKIQMPVFYLQHMDRPGGLFDPSGHGGAFIPSVAPDNDEFIVPKTMANGFAMSGLDDQLRNIGCNELIIAGFMTHMSISLTARAAMERGYMASVLSGACAAAVMSEQGNNRDLRGSVHDHALSTLVAGGVNVVAKMTEFTDLFGRRDLGSGPID